MYQSSLLIKPFNVHFSESRPVQDEEEVFAESYDDVESKESAPGSDPFRINKKMSTDAAAAGEKAALKVSHNRHLGHAGCPNKWNAYHECSSYCRSHWVGGKVEPDPDYLAKYKNMMTRYGPLPEGWKEHYDPGTGRHYFWCTRTDRVSWLPPGHPKAKPVEAASSLREMLQGQMHAAAAAAAAAAAGEAEKEDDDEDDDDDDDDEDQAMDLDSDMVRHKVPPCNGVDSLAEFAF
jgi:polyglutamine-binding protein 1